LTVAYSLDLWNELQNEIISCNKCARLVTYRSQVAREKRRQFRDFNYWGRPVPSNGSPGARLVIIGLAPAAHGGNRTGRMFTGDGSAKFLFKHLYMEGFVNQPNSDHREDGQRLNDCYITAVVHCVPPDNKLKPLEIENCSRFLSREFDLLQNPKAVLALGKVAFDSIIDFAKIRYHVRGRFQFRHGEQYTISNEFPPIFASYHPSPRNTQTGKLTSKMFLKVLQNIRKSLQT
jgi:uracil-DNA glycosylase